MQQPATPSPGRKLGGYLLKYGIPLVISAGLCWLLLRTMDLRGMWHIIHTQASFGWLALNLAMALLAQLWRALRWQLQLRALGIEPGLWQVFLAVMGTYSVNLVFPRLGEVWRTGYISARCHAPFAAVFGSMVADRLADTLTVGLITLATFLFAAPQLAEYLGQGGGALARIGDLLASPWLWGAVAALTVFVVGVMFKCPANPVVARVRLIAGRLWEGFAVIARMRGKGLWLLYTVLLWGSYVAGLYFAFFSLPLTAQLISAEGARCLMVCFVLTSVSMGVPSNGGIGPWQWAMIIGLGFYSDAVAGLTRDYAATFANLVMGVTTLGLIVQGLFTFACIAISRKR